MLYLVVIKLAKVFHIHFALVYVNDNGIRAKLRIGSVDALYRLYNVGKLADSRRLDNNSVGVQFVKHLAKRGGKITDERAADTARVHFGYFNSRIAEKAAVNSDFSKFVFNQNELFTDVRLGYKLLDKRGFSRAEKARKNIYFRH